MFRLRERNPFALYRMLVAALISVFVARHVAAEIPSYIQVCGRKDPNIKQCILDNVYLLKDKICKGIPELDIAPSETFVLENVVLSDSDNVKIFLDKLSIIGLCDYKINSFDVDIEKNHFEVDLTFNKFEINATYNIDLRIIVAIATRGPVYITTEKVLAKVVFDLDTVMKNGIKYVYVSNMKIKLDVKKYTAQYDYQDNETLYQLREAIANFISNNQKDIISLIVPSIEKVVSERTLIVSNKLLKHFTYDELFPDRT